MDWLFHIPTWAAYAMIPLAVVAIALKATDND